MSRLFYNYKSRASISNKDFCLTKNQFVFISEGNCFYCGISFDKKEKVNGIDRLDNSIGYVYDNCVPCCWICNRAKSDLSIEDFYKWVKRLSGRLNYIFDESMNLDKKHSLDLKRNKTSNCLQTKSYEEDAMNRAYDILYACHIPENIIKKIIRKSNNSSCKECLIKFIFKIDSYLYPESTNYILSLNETPLYLKNLNSDRCALLSDLDYILIRLNLSKSEIKSIEHLYKKEVVLSCGSESKRL